MSAADATIQKKIYGTSTTALIISNEEKGGIMKIDKSLEESGLLIKGISETIKNEATNKTHKKTFILMLLGTLFASIFRHAIAGKGVVIAGENF